MPALLKENVEYLHCLAVGLCYIYFINDAALLLVFMNESFSICSTGLTDIVHYRIAMTSKGAEHEYYLQNLPLRIGGWGRESTKPEINLNGLH